MALAEVVVVPLLVCLSSGFGSCQDASDFELEGFDVIYGDPESPPRYFDPDPWGAQPVYDPTTYASSDGVWSYHQDPSRRSGKGPSSGRLERSGTTVWERRLPLTFDHVAISDEGHVIGYGVQRDFQVWLFDAEGVSRIVQRIRPTGSTFFHTPDNPRISGIVVHPDLGRFAIRVSDPDLNRGVEEWLVYQLADGTPLLRIRPKEQASKTGPLIHIIGTHPIKGSELMLLQWTRHSRSGFGTRFTLIDEEGRELWMLDRPGDFNVPAGEEESYSDRLVRQGTVVDTGVPGQFEVALITDAQRVRYEVLPGEGGRRGEWGVREIGREPYVWGRKETAKTEIQDVELELLGTVKLAAGDAAASPVHSIAAFEPLEGGEIEFVRKTDGGFDLVRIDRSGALIREIRIQDVLEREDWREDWCRIEEDLWICIRSTSMDEPTEAWFVDAATGESIRLEDFEFPNAYDMLVAADRSGGFVIGADYSRPSGMSLETLRAYDSEGRLRWRIGDGTPNELTSTINGVAVTTEGELVLMGSVCECMHIFDLDGEFAGEVDLAEAWGRAPGYLCGMISEVGGGVILRDSEGEHDRLWRTDLDGSECTYFEPRYADGRADPVLAIMLRVAPNGELWTSNLNVLLRLDEEGLEVERFGLSAQSDTLVEPVHGVLDELGRICISDAATSSVHVFDLDGRRLFLARSDPDDFGRLSINGLTTDPSGVLHVEVDYFDARGLYVGFAADGTRIGKKKLGRGATRFLPGTGRRWCRASASRLELLDEDGGRLAKIDKMPDGRWYHYIRDFAVARDGSLAVMDTHEVDTPSGRGFQISLAIYGPDGEPRRTRSLPVGIRAYEVRHGGEWLACSGEEAILLVHLESGEVLRMRARERASAVRFFLGFVADGTELLAVDLEAREARRYALPSPR